MAEQDIIDALNASREVSVAVLDELRLLRESMNARLEKAIQDAPAEPEWDVEPTRGHRYTTKGYGHHLRNYHPEVHAAMTKRRKKGYYKDMPMWKLAIEDYGPAARPQKGAPGALLCLLCSNGSE